MSGSLTVIGGHSGSSLTGLVTTPSGFTISALNTGLQAILTGVSNDVLSGTAKFENFNAVTGDSVGSAGSSPTEGVFVISNTNADGTTVPGALVDSNFTVPNGYNNLVVQAPGAETVSGNGSSNFLAIFGAQSSVTFNSSGSGSVVAGGPGDYVGLVSGAWSVLTSGLDTVDSSASTATIVTTGEDNVVGLLGGVSTVVAGGSGDLVEAYNAGDSVVVSVTGFNDRVLVDGGSVTVDAVLGSSSLNAFFEKSGGSLTFINQSGVADSVTGVVPGGTGGSDTVYGGSGGGNYTGGLGGNNSLFGGTGLVTLYAAGTGNLLSVTGAGTGTGGNYLSVGLSGTSSLVASASTTNNTFQGGEAGSTTITSFGSGSQNYFVGAGDAELITGSTTSGAVNNYYFDQDSTGHGADIITNFRLGTDHLYINHIGGASGVSITGVQSLGGGVSGSIVYLSDKTTIQLYGVSASSIASVVGGTSI